MLRQLLLLLLLTSCALAEPSPKKIDKIFAGMNNRPGCAVAVVHGSSVYLKGYGLADLKRKLPIDPDTAFDLASVSKQFTATAVMILADRGQLSYSDPLGKFFPQMPGYARPVTVAQLLHHTSGLPNVQDYSTATLQDRIDDLKQQEPAHKPDQAYEYLNLGYDLLGLEVEKVAGMPIGQFFQQEIFARLNMQHTQFLGREGQVIPGRAVGYKKARGKWKVAQDDCPGTADGNVFSTARDLSLWAQDLLKGSTVLRPQTLKAAWKSGRLANGEAVDYGYGWELYKYSKRIRKISHTGSWDGTSTFIGLWPEADLAVVVLSNDEDQESEELGDSVAALYLP